MKDDYPNVEIVRDRLPILRKRGRVHRVGDVNLHGNDEYLWYCGQIPDRQHQAEITEMLLGSDADEIRRLYDVDPELRSDAEIVAGEVVLLLEHECSQKSNRRQIIEKMERYADRPVLWTCKTQTYLDKLASHATSDKHLFTLYSLAVEDFHGPIWVDRHGKVFSLPLPVQFPVQ